MRKHSTRSPLGFPASSNCKTRDFSLICTPRHLPLQTRVCASTQSASRKSADETNPGLSKPPSFERRRPSNAQPSPEGPRRPRPSFNNHNANMEYDYDHLHGSGYAQRPPFAPEVPLSPTSSNAFSSGSSTSHSSMSKKHWLPRLFERAPPTTPLVATGRSYVACLLRYGVSLIVEQGLFRRTPTRRR